MKKPISFLAVLVLVVTILLLTSWAPITGQLVNPVFASDNTAYQPLAESTSLVLFGIVLISLAALSRKIIKK